MYKSFSADEYRKHLQLPQNYKVDAVICYGTLYENRMIAVLEKVLEDMGIKAELKPLENEFLRFIREFKIGDKTIWFMIGYGGAWISEYIHWACLFGSQTNILVGSCGGLKQGLSRSDFIVPSSSYGQESSVRLYNRESPLQFPSEKLSEQLARNLGSNDNTKVWRGPIVTCQAMIGETAEDVETWSKDGYYGVEMESSTVFAVSSHFGVPAAASLYIGDNLIEGHSNVGNDYLAEADIRHQKQTQQLRAAIKTIIQINE